LAQLPVLTVDASRLVDWSNAGMQSSAITVAANFIDYSDYTVGTEYQKICDAIDDANALSGSTIIYFPPGTYTVAHTVTITSASNDGMIFMGASSGTSILSFAIHPDVACFNVTGAATGAVLEADADIAKGATTISGSFSGLEDTLSVNRMAASLRI